MEGHKLLASLVLYPAFLRFPQVRRVAQVGWSDSAPAVWITLHNEP
jgi:hypothetical protein